MNTRARVTLARPSLMLVGVAAALGTATNSMPVGLGVGLAVTVVLMVVFTRAGARKRHPGAGDGTDAGHGTDRVQGPGDDTDPPA